MKAKGQYNTNQRKELQSYLETIAGEHTTVAEICGHFSALGKSIGTSTVYRQLERLVDEGLVEKYIVDASSPACFVYVGEHITNVTITASVRSVASFSTLPVTHLIPWRSTFLRIMTLFLITCVPFSTVSAEIAVTNQC